MNRRLRFLPLACIAFTGPVIAQEEFAGRDLVHCAIDIPVHCGGTKPGGGRVVQCLQERRADITPECRAAVTPSDFTDATDGLQIEVTVDNLKSTQGVLIVMLNEDADRFPESAKRTVIAPVTGDSVTVRFKHLKAGTFAVAALHDLNEDSQFSTGEGFAANNGATGRPSFAASAMQIDASRSITISMLYP